MTPREEWHLPTARLGRRVLLFDCLESTNTFAAALAHDRNNDGLVILADEQTAGRGQHGRSWWCQRGAGVLASILLFPPSEIRRPVILAALAAVAVCRTITALTGLQPQIKWPNDVLVSGRKVCGILIEQAHGTVVGIGLNVNQSADSLSEATLPQAASLASITGRSYDCSDVARRLIAQLDEEYERLCQSDLHTLEAAWRRHLGLAGHQVVVECLDQVYQGRLRDIAWDALTLELQGSHFTSLSPEAVRHIHLRLKNSETTS